MEIPDSIVYLKKKNLKNFSAGEFSICYKSLNRVENIKKTNALNHKKASSVDFPTLVHFTQQTNFLDLKTHRF